MNIKKLILKEISLLIIFITIFFSCEKSNVTEATNEIDDLIFRNMCDLFNELFPEKEINENHDSIELEKSKNVDFPYKLKPRTPSLPYEDVNIIFEIEDLIYKGGGVGSMRYDEYFDLSTGDLMDYK